jgi:pentatricopeptide repeat protein
MTATEIRAAIIAHCNKTGTFPNYSTIVGRYCSAEDYNMIVAVCAEMRAKGEIIDEVRLSKTGKRMTYTVLAEQVGA